MDNFFFCSVLLKLLRYSFPSLLYPALPALALYLHCGDTLIKHYIVMAGFGFFVARLSLMLWGDCYKTKTTLLTVLPLIVLGSLCIYSKNIILLLCGSFIVASACGIAVTVVPVYLHEVYRGNTAKKLGVIDGFTSVFALLVMLLAAYMIVSGWWREVIFISMILAVLAMLYTNLISMPNTRLVHGMSQQRQHYRAIIGKDTFRGMALCYAFIYGGSICFSIVLPFLLIKHFHFSPFQYVLIMLPSYLAEMLGGFVCALIYSKLSLKQYFFFFYFMYIISVLCLLIAYFIPAVLIVMLIVSTCMFYFSLAGMTAYINARVVILFPEAKNAALGIQGILTSIVICVCGLIVVHLDDHNTLVLACFLLGLLLLSFVSFFVAKLSFLSSS